MPAPVRYPWFVRHDLDGFFGLLVDNLVQILVIAELGVAVAGLDRAFIYGTVLPGVALSVVFGNVFYSWQARRIALREGREDMTALPYGINTPSVFAFLLFIMGPVYLARQGTLGVAGAARLAWQAGLVACFLSGVIELAGASVGGWIRRKTPRAALLCALAGIAIGFISMDFTLQVFERPLLALVPAGIILIQYFSGVRLPLGLPAGLVAILVGTALAWGLKALAAGPLFAALPPGMQEQLAWEVARMPGGEAVRAALAPALAWPRLCLGDLWQGFMLPEVWHGLGIIIPMALFNLIGSLQNIESAEAAGDRYPTGPSLAVNGLGSILAACCGSCFPTTLYIGHAGWKRLGARTGYSVLSGVTIAVLCFTGLIRAFSALVPPESIVGILVWIAIIIGAQAFQAIPTRHAPAVVLGLFPPLAAWGLLTFNRGFMSAGKMLPDLSLSGALPEARLGGMIGLDRGFILTSMGWAALGVYLIDRKFRSAAAWAAMMAVLSLGGIIHAWNPANLGEPFSPGGGWRYAIPYFLLAGMLLALAPQADRLAAQGNAPGFHGVE